MQAQKRVFFIFLESCFFLFEKKFIILLVFLKMLLFERWTEFFWTINAVKIWTINAESCQKKLNAERWTELVFWTATSLVFTPPVFRSLFLRVGGSCQVGRVEEGQCAMDSGSQTLEIAIILYIWFRRKNKKRLLVKSEFQTKKYTGKLWINFAVEVCISNFHQSYPNLLPNYICRIHGVRKCTK